MRPRRYIIIMFTVALGMSVVCGLFDGLTIGFKLDRNLWEIFLSVGAVLCVLAALTALMPLEKEVWRKPVAVLMLLVAPLYLGVFQKYISVHSLLWGAVWLGLASVAVMIELFRSTE